jgi:hypothetical protein
VVTQRLTANAKVATSPEFDPSIHRHSRIFGAADEAVLNKVQKISPCKNDLLLTPDKLVERFVLDRIEYTKRPNMRKIERSDTDFLYR